MPLTVGWTIGKHRVELVDNGALVTVTIDEVDQRLPIASWMLGEWILDVGKRKAVLRRVRNLDVARVELVLDGVRVPPSEFRIPRRRAPEGALCGRHPASPPPPAAGEGGGDAAASAKGPAKARIDCGVCGVSVCRECTAVDGVRCRACFDLAAAQTTEAIRRGRTLGPLVAVGLGAFVLVVGLVGRWPTVFGIGGMTIVLTVVTLISGRLQERAEARRRRL